MIKTLIVDDERLARTELKRLLQSHENIDIVAEATNGEDAIAYLKNNDVELVFLDIQMPGMTGLELAEVIPSSVKFVFCTAFDQYAVDAFALNAIDYLVKPIEPSRLARCLERVQELTEEHTETPIEEHAYLPDNHGVMLKFGDINRIVRLFEIERFESVGNHAAVYTQYGKSFIHSSLAKIESRLDPQQFFKANRGDIIRIDTIDRIEPGIKAGSSSAFLRSGQEVEISRRQAQQLKHYFSGF